MPFPRSLVIRQILFRKVSNFVDTHIFCRVWRTDIPQFCRYSLISKEEVLTKVVVCFGNTPLQLRIFWWEWRTSILHEYNFCTFAEYWHNVIFIGSHCVDTLRMQTAEMPQRTKNNKGISPVAFGICISSLCFIYRRNVDIYFPSHRLIYCIRSQLKNWGIKCLSFSGNQQKIYIKN